MKFQWIAWFAIGSHAIHVQAQCDPCKQWLPTPYKLSDVELETIVDDWATSWRELVILEEVSMGPPTDALVDPIHDLD